jgi:hypothetical protein
MIPVIPMTRDVYAYAFKTELALAEILQRLNDVGPWRWIERDNDRWGAYISARPLAEPYHGLAKIFVEPDHHAISVTLRSDAADPQPAFAGVRKVILEVLLPALAAREVVETQDYD